MAALQPRRRLDDAGLGCSPFARRYWGNHCCFLFLQVLRCFSSLRVPRQHVCAPVPRLQRGGLSHSETRGSTVTCTYPRIIAACHVLHRQREPRHPPYALKCFLSRTAPNPRNRGGDGSGSGIPLDVLSGTWTSRLVLVYSLACGPIPGRPGAAHAQGMGRERDGGQARLCHNMSMDDGLPSVHAPGRGRRGAGGEYRIRTDDPLLAKQVL